MKHIVIAVLAVMLAVCECTALEIRAVAHCVVECDSTDIYLRDARSDDMPEQLLGVLYNNDALYVYDEISEGMIAIDCSGNIRFRYGTVGPGPGEHYGHCDPIMWGGRSLALVDYGLPTEVIVLDDKGGYVSSLSLEAMHNSVQVLWSGDRAISVEHHHEIDRNWVTVFVELVSYNSTGAAISSAVIGEKYLDMRPGHDVLAEDLEIFPRIAGRDGRIYVQPDVHVPLIRCYTSKLELIWEKALDVVLCENVRPYVNPKYPNVIPSVYAQPLRGLWPRANGELWVEMHKNDVSDNDKHYRVFDDRGEYRFNRTVTGIGVGVGCTQYDGDYILWSNTAYIQADEKPMIAVYMLE